MVLLHLLPFLDLNAELRQRVASGLCMLRCLRGFRTVRVNESQHKQMEAVIGCKNRQRECWCLCVFVRLGIGALQRDTTLSPVSSD